MALQLILGGSGYGKSHLLYEKIIGWSIKSPELSYYAIVPEQYTVQTEKDIIGLHPRRGIMNIDVLSFRRMAYRVLEETGVRKLPLLDDTGKNLVLRKVIESEKDKLVLYRNKVKLPGFVEEVKSVIAELYQYGVDDETLCRMQEAAAKRPMLKAKLSDISLIRNAFREYIKESYITSEELLEVLAREIPKSGKIRDSIVFFDGFTGFTPIQYKVIGLLLSYAKEVIVTVTADTTDNLYAGEDKESLFGLSRTTISKLTRLAKDAGVEKNKDIELTDAAGSRFADEEALRFLEMHLFRGHKAVYEPFTEAIQITEAANPREEAHSAADTILALVRDEGCRFQDIAVVTGDLEGYSELLCESLSACSIPCFVDSKTRLMGNPLVEAIRSVFEISRTDYSFESVFRLLRTGMTGMETTDIDYLENYCQTLGIRGGRRWNSLWTRSHIKGRAADFDRINTLREQVITPLFPVTELLRKKDRTVREKMTVLHGLLCEDSYRCAGRLAEYRAEFEKRGEAAAAKEYEQAYKLIMELFDKVVGLLGDERLSVSELSDIMDSGFEELKVGIIPPSVDRVLIGDMERSRLGQVKYLFFVGVNDGIVPKNKKSGGIISDTERSFLSEESFELAPTARQNIYVQRYYLYLNITKPSKRLYVSYSMADGSGARKPSVLVRELCKLFPSVETGRVSGDITTPEGSLGLFIGGLKKGTFESHAERARFEELFSWYLDDEHWKSKIDSLLSAAFYENKESSIAKEVAASLYGPQPINSVTRLEQYAACAYAHFLTYGLRLKEREEFEVTSLDLGNLFHYTLEAYAAKLKENGLCWQSVTEEERSRLVSEAIDAVCADYKGSVLESSARNAYMRKRLQRITERTVWAVGEQLKHGDFVPVQSEVVFSEGQELEALTIELPDGRVLKLRGRIDRMDICDDGDKRYLKVIDYKSGSTRFDISSAYYGLQLQLLVYMEAAREAEAAANPGKSIVPAGMFYYNISDSLVENSGEESEESIRNNILKQLCVNGLVNESPDVIRHLDKEMDRDSAVIPLSYKADGTVSARSQVINDDRYRELSGYVKNKIREMGFNVLSGDVAPKPYELDGRSGCDYCGFKGICGYDKSIKGFESRKLKKLKPEEVWQKIKEAEADGDGMERKTEGNN